MRSAGPACAAPRRQPPGATHRPGMPRLHSTSGFSLLRQPPSGLLAPGAGAGAPAAPLMRFAGRTATASPSESLLSSALLGPPPSAAASAAAAASARARRFALDTIGDAWCSGAAVPARTRALFRQSRGLPSPARAPGGGRHELRAVGARGGAVGGAGGAARRRPVSARPCRLPTWRRAALLRHARGQAARHGAHRGHAAPAGGGRGRRSAEVRGARAATPSVSTRAPAPPRRLSLLPLTRHTALLLCTRQAARGRGVGAQPGRGGSGCGHAGCACGTSRAGGRGCGRRSRVRQALLHRRLRGSRRVRRARAAGVLLCARRLNRCRAAACRRRADAPPRPARAATARRRCTRWTW